MVSAEGGTTRPRNETILPRWGEEGRRFETLLPSLKSDQLFHFNISTKVSANSLAAKGPLAVIIFPSTTTGSS